MQRLLESFAASKAILLGEHAVVYGIDALAIALDRGAHAVPCSAREIRIDAAGSTRSFVWEGDTDIARAWQNLRLFAGGGATVAGAHVRLDVPPGAGLGSSAAVGLAVARIFYPELAKHPGWLFNAGQVWERTFHGNPSGIDVACSLYGGAILYSRPRGVTNVPVSTPLYLVLATTGQIAKTSDMVAKVRAQFDASRQDVEKCFTHIGELVRAGARAIELGDHARLGVCMNENHVELSALQLSTERIEALCTTARTAGALGAKLTGAGGGGAVVALAKTQVDQTRIADALREQTNAWRGEVFLCQVQPANQVFESMLGAAS